VLIGVGGGGIEENTQNELKLKMGLDFTPTVHGRLLLGYWTMERESGREGDTTYLRDLSGNPVYSGAVDIGGFRYSVPATSFSPRAGEETHWISGLSLKTTRPEGWNYEAVVTRYEMLENLTRNSSTAPPAAFSGGTGTLNDWDGSGWWTVDFKVDRKPYDGERHWVTFGAHQDTYEMDQKDYAAADWRNGGPTGTNAIFLGKTQTQALFAQDSWRFAEHWRTVLGVRYEIWRALDGSRTNAVPTTVTYPDRRETAVSPKAALEFMPSTRWLYRLSLAQATRFPTVTELFQGSISGNQIVNSDPNLKPEEAISLDLTAERVLERGLVRMSIWADDTKDVLFRQANTAVVPSITNYQNIDHVRIWGIELSYDATQVLLKGLDLSANVARNFSEILENTNNPSTVGNEFYRIPNWRAGVVGTYHQTEQLAYSLAGRYSGKQYGTLENTDVNHDAFDGVSSYLVFDAKISYDINRHFNASLGVDNLTDERYFVGHPYAGRTFFAELKAAY
jgi:iron complex outermembrane receptor protein